MPVTYKTYWLILVMGFLSWTAYSQHFIEVGFDQHSLNAKTQADSLYLVVTNYPVTGIILHFQADDDPEGSFITVKTDTFYFHPDEDATGDKQGIYSNLCTYPVPIDTFLFYPGNLKQPVSFIYIDSRLPEEKELPLTKKKSDGCSEPEMIDQSVWREGLDDPDYERIPNKVHNIIIHHSAGSNTDTNYIQVVRSIYIYHTEYRGWSDIGYNYLIAQDGTIFKGRDPGELEQDNVLGAHFCASNTGTMGICVLGDYMEVSPPESAIQSLIDLVAWKLGKDSLDPLGTYPHPLNSELPVIAGHRDGCATLCPGDSLYNEFPLLRLDVMEAFNQCGYSINSIEVQDNHFDELSVSVSGNEIFIYHPNSKIENISLSDLQGRIFTTIQVTRSYHTIRIPIEPLKPGIYILIFYNGSSLSSYKVMIL